MQRLIKIILLIMNVVAVALLLASTLAGTVEPSRFIGFSLLSYGYLYFMIANIVFIILWLCLSSKWFVMSLAAILVRFSFVPLFFQIGGTDSAPDGTDDVARRLKVMTFNAHRFIGTAWDADGGDIRKDGNMVEFLNIVETEQPDVIAMQEYMGRGDTIRLTKRLEKMGYGHSASGYDDGHLSGEVIFSKLPIVRVVRIDGPSKFYAKLLLGDDTVSLFCLHLGSYKLDTSDKRQIYDLSHGNVDGQSGRGTLRKFRETILVHEKEWLSLKPYFEGNRHHTIVAGDFNETPASYFYSQCQKYFTDSYCEAGQGFSTTYHGTFTRQRAATFPAFRIDMVMHTPDLEALSYKRIKCNASDHYPVVVTMELKK